jgi:alpha-tubulin suppressor-like RCC1 family protein
MDILLYLLLALAKTTHQTLHQLINPLCMQGELYTVGYNDRGQLGLGHRINVSTFQPVVAMAGVVVLEICCGQSHNLARVDPMSLADSMYAASGGSKEAEETMDDGSSGSGSSGGSAVINAGDLIGGTISSIKNGDGISSGPISELFTWGSNVLGQLGIGSFRHAALLSPQASALSHY